MFIFKSLQMAKQEIPIIVRPFRSFRDKLGPLINNHLANLDSQKSDYDKKVLELCHIGKFLVLLNENYSITEVREKPDFIISDTYNSVGVEHEILVRDNYKKQEGSIKQLFKQAERAFTIKYPGKNLLINIFIKKGFPIFKKNQTNLLVENINILIADYLDYGILPENELVDDIFAMPHHQLNFEPNEGAWGQATLTEDLLKNAIEKKEKLLKTYIDNSGTKDQWLVIVIGSMGKSSLQMNNNINSVKESGFARIYLLEDFNGEIVRLK